MTVRKKLTLFSGTSSAMSASNWNIASNSAIALIELEGWDETPEIIRNSTPVLWSNVTAVSKDATFGPRNITVTMQVMGTATELFEIRSQVLAMLSDINAPRTLALTIYDQNGSELQRETLRCLFTSQGFLWEEMNGSATLTIKMVAPNPLKTIVKNGVNRGEQI